MLQDCYSNEKIMINQYKPQDFEETYVLTSPYLPIIHKKSLDFLEATHFIQDMIGNDKTDQDKFRKNTIINLPGNSFTAASEMWHYVSAVATQCRLQDEIPATVPDDDADEEEILRAHDLLCHDISDGIWWVMIWYIMIYTDTYWWYLMITHVSNVFQCYLMCAKV